MAKIIAGIALIAGAVALDIMTGGAATPLLASLIPAMGAIGASLTLTGIADELRGGPQNAVSVKQPAAPRQVIYGSTRVTGTIVYMASTGEQQDLNQVCVWASHPIQSIDAFYLDGRLVFASTTTDGYGATQCDSNTHYDDAGNQYNLQGLATYQHILGSTGGTWCQSLYEATEYYGAGGAVWDSTCMLNGMAATYCRAKYNATIFNSQPAMKANVHGKCDIYDPRTGTTGWTNNAALIIADYLCNTDFGFGCNYSVEIDQTQLIAAANICDEQVPLATVPGAWQASTAYAIGQSIIDSNGRLETVQGYIGAADADGNYYSGGSEPIWDNITNAGQLAPDNGIYWESGDIGQGLTESRYTINGAFNYAANRGDILDQMLQSMEGRLTVSGGVIKIFPAAWYSTSLEFDQNSFVGPVKWTPNRKFRDLYNCVRATYVCPVYPYEIVGYDKNHRDPNVFSGEYQPTDAPEYAQDSLHGYTTDVNLAQDGGVRLYQDRHYQFVQSCATVQRLMKIYLLRNRYQGSGTLQMNLAAYQTQAQDVVQMTFPTLGWSNQNLEVTNFRFVPKISHDEHGNESPSLACELDVCETDPSVYTWSTAEERGMENTNSPALADMWQVNAPTGLTLTSGSSTAVIQPDGTVTPRILAQWTEPNDPFVTTGGYIIVSLQPVSTGVWQPYITLAGTTTQCWIRGVVCGQQYNVSITAVRASGAYSAALEVGPHTVSTTYSSLNSNGIELNIPSNITNDLTIDFVESDGVVSVRVYGPGGVGTSGTVTLGSGATYTIYPITFSSVSASTAYFCYFNPANDTDYLVPVSGMASAVADGYLALGSVVTCTASGSGGVIGGGASGGLGGPKTGVVNITGTASDSGSGSSSGEGGGSDSSGGEGGGGEGGG